MKSQMHLKAASSYSLCAGVVHAVASLQIILLLMYPAVWQSGGMEPLKEQSQWAKL